MSEIEAVLFDLDGTLCRYQQSSAELLGKAFEELEVTPFFGVDEYYDNPI